MKLKDRIKKLNQTGVLHHVVPIAAFLVLFGVIGAYFYATSSRAATIPELRSGMVLNGVQYCLDDHGDGSARSIVDAWACNGTPAQVFSYDYNDSEIHVGAGCVVPSEAKSATTGFTQEPVVISTQCGEGQAVPWGGAWSEIGNTLDGYVFENNHADSKAGNGTWCLDITGATAEAPVEIFHCNQQTNQRWYPDTFNNGGSNGGSGGGTSTPGSGTAIASLGKLIEVNKNGSGLCVNAKGTTEGSVVDLEQCSTTMNKNQMWNSVLVAANNSTKTTSVQLKLIANTSECLDNWQQADTNGTLSIRLYPCNISDLGQLWWNPSSSSFSQNQLVNAGAYNRTSGKGAECLDNYQANNTQLDIYTCKTNSEGNTNQQFYSDAAPKPPVTQQTPTSQTPTTQTESELTQSQAQVTQENLDLETIIQSLPSSQKAQISCSQLQSQYARALFDCPQTSN